MSFTFMGNIYPDVASLITELTNSEAHSEGETNSLPLNISCDIRLGPENPSLQTLLNFITQPSRKRIYHINPPLSPEDESINKLLRQATTMAELTQASLQINKRRKEKTTNPAKIDLVNKRRVPVPVQILHLIEPHPQHQAPLQLATPALAHHPAPLTSAAPSALLIPTLEQYQAFFPNHKLNETIYNKLIQPAPILIEHFNDFLTAIGSPYQKDIETALLNLQESKLHGLIAKLLLIGRETTALTCISLFKELKDKQVSLAFLMETVPDPIEAFSTPLGIKTLYELTKFKPDQLDWWNTLVQQHLQHNPQGFKFIPTFNSYVEFLQKISELGLSKLPIPCPIKNSPTITTTLDDIYTILKNAKEKGENTLHAQSEDLAELNWGPNGAAFAVKHGDFGYVHKDMDIGQPDAINVAVEDIDLNNNEPIKDTWLLRFFAKHWKNGVSLGQIKRIKQLIETLPAPEWTPLCSKKLMFIVACTFSAPGELDDKLWQQQVNDFIATTQTLPLDLREKLLGYLSQCYQFKPTPPTLPQLQFLLKTLIGLLPPNPDEETIVSTVTPILYCYLREGPEIITSLITRLEKFPSPTAALLESAEAPAERPLPPHKALLALPVALGNLRPQLEEVFQEKANQIHFTRLLACLSELNPSELEQQERVLKLARLLAEQPQLCTALASLNLDKSKTLPTLEKLEVFLNSPACRELMADPNAQEVTWLIQQLNDRDCLPGSLFGEAQLSQLNDLVMEAIAKFFTRPKLISEYFLDIYNKNFKESDDPDLPPALRESVHPNFIEVHKALIGLERVACKPSPSLDSITTAIKELEKTINTLFDTTYPLRLIYKAPGKTIFELVATGRASGAILMNRFGGAKAHNKLKAGLNKDLVKEAEDQLKNATDPETKNTLTEIVKQQKELVVNILRLLVEFNKTPSIIIFFEEELIKKRVEPQVTATLNTLEVEDPLKETILNIVKTYDKTPPAAKALLEYNDRLIAVRELLNTLRNLKNALPPGIFAQLSGLLSLAGLQSLSLRQQTSLLSTLLEGDLTQIPSRLNILNELISTKALLLPVDIERAIAAIPQLFALKNVSPEQQNRLLSASFKHNLKSDKPFPFEPIILLQNSPNLDPAIKNKLLKQFINLLEATNIDLRLLTDVIKETCDVLISTPAKIKLIFSLLNRLNLAQLNTELKTYRFLLTCKPQTSKEEAISSGELAHNEASVNIHAQPEENAVSSEEAVHSQVSDRQIEQILHIITCLSDTDDTSVSLDMIKRIVTSLTDVPKRLDHVYRLFLTLPYPNANMLEQALALPLDELKSYCKGFDLNPFARPGETRPVEKHFSMASTSGVLQGLKDLKLDHALSHPFQIELAQRLNHINELGSKYKASSRDELKNTTKRLLDDFRSHKPGYTPDHRDFEYHQHLLLANIRELYYRTTCTTDSQGNKTGLFPNSTQMLTLLLSLSPKEKLFPEGIKNADSLANLLMQIKTGQGKSIVTPLLGALLWGQGGTVDICTANTDLLERDYYDNYQPLFHALNLPSNLIRAHSPTNTYVKNGINCSTLKEMGLFRMTAAHNRQPINPEGDKTHILLDEVDTILDKTPILCLGRQPTGETDVDPLDWLFPIIYDFIHLDSFRNLDGGAWSEEDDVAELTKYIRGALKNDLGRSQKLQQLATLPNQDQTLLKFIKAACRVELLEVEQDFILQPEEKDEGMETKTKFHVLPISESSGIFPDGWQAALLARLQREYPTRKNDFNIPPTASILDYQSIQRLIQSYKQTGGRMIGISGTISGTRGTRPELRYLNTQYGFEALDIPPHEGNRRVEHEPHCASSREENAALLIRSISRIRQPYSQPSGRYNSSDTKKDADRRFAREQPPSLLISTKNIKEARYYTEEIRQWAREHINPICFIVDDIINDQVASNKKREAFKLNCLSEQLNLNMKLAKADTIKVILASELTPAVSTKLTKQGYSLQYVTGTESPKQIQDRLKQAFYQVQFIDGTESTQALKQKIAQAGTPNMITIGPVDKLGRGVDVKNENQHLEGVSIFPTSIEINERMERQIAGRVGRNGDPGHVYPHYQITLPSIWWQKLLYWGVPLYRRKFLRQQQKAVQTKLAEEAAVERIYSQRIDEVQQCLITQFNAWTHLFLDNAAENSPIAATLLEIRSELLSEVRNYQSSFVTTLDVDAKIASFENNLNELWDKYKSEKLIPCYKSIKLLTPAQEIGFPYLETLSLKQEMLVQPAFSSSPDNHLAALSRPAREQTLDMALANKAGSTLTYEEPLLKPEDSTQLRKLEMLQILPHFIYDLEKQCPNHTSDLKAHLLPEVTTHSSPLHALVTQVGSWFSRLSRWVLNVVARLKRVVSDTKPPSPEVLAAFKETRITEINNQLENLPEERRRNLLTFIESILIAETKISRPLAQQFKLQNLILTFSKLLPDEGPKEEFKETESRFTNGLMEEIACMIVQKLSWARDEPQSFVNRPLHVNLERPAVIKAASDIYRAADHFLANRSTPNPEDANQMLYQILQKQAHVLRPLTILSLGHTNPREVVLDALDAIDTLKCAPTGCDEAFRRHAHDKALIQIHLETFSALLETQSKSFPTVNRWLSLKQRLNQLLELGGVEVGTLISLQACILRFQKDTRFQGSLRSPLRTLEQHLAQSIRTLSKPHALATNPEPLSRSFLTHQAEILSKKLGEKLELDPNKRIDIALESGFDGLHDYVELKLAPVTRPEEQESQEALRQQVSKLLGLTQTYKSSSSTKKIFQQQRTDIENTWKRLQENAEVCLTKEFTPNTYDYIPSAFHQRVDNIIELERLLTTPISDWPDLSAEEDLSEIAQLRSNILALQKINWAADSIPANPLLVEPPPDIKILLETHQKLKEDFTKVKQTVEEETSPAILKKLGQALNILEKPISGQAMAKITADRAALIIQGDKKISELVEQNSDKLLASLAAKISSRKHSLMTDSRQMFAEKLAHLDTYQKQEINKANTSSLRFFSPAAFCDFTIKLDDEANQVKNDVTPVKVGFFERLKRNIKRGKEDVTLEYSPSGKSEPSPQRS